MSDLKAAGDTHAKAHRNEEAFDAYSRAIARCPRSSVLLCNRSLVATRLKNHERALADAEAALQIVTSDHEGDASDEWLAQLTKAYYRKAAALEGLDRHRDACTALCDALKIQPRDPTVTRRLRQVMNALPVMNVCEYWAAAIADAESPSLASSRDGKLLKPVRPQSLRMTRTETTAVLVDMAVGNEAAWRDELCASWSTGRDPGRGILSLIRARAYLQNGRITQALADAKAAVAYAPKRGWAEAHALHAAAIEQASVAPPQPLGASAAPTTGADDLNDPGSHNTAAAAPITRVVLAKSGEAGCEDNLFVDPHVAAAVEMARAAALAPGNEHYVQELQRLAARLPEAQVRATARAPRVVCVFY